MFTGTLLLNLPLTESPLIPVLIICGYLYFVLRCGPKYMNNREPYSLRPILLSYNAAQAVANAIMVYAGINVYAANWNDNLVCLRIDRATAILSYCYHLNKYSDLLETIFFILRKKNKQVSFLHVFHHIIMVFSTYLICVLSPGILFFGEMLRST